MDMRETKDIAAPTWQDIIDRDKRIAELEAEVDRLRALIAIFQAASQSNAVARQKQEHIAPLVDEAKGEKR